jgi:hypothetical protein
MPSHHQIVHGKLRVRPSNDSSIPLALTLRFSEDRFTFRKWKLLGLIEGELFVAVNTAFLVLELDGCDAPDSDWYFDEPITLRIDFDETVILEAVADDASVRTLTAKTTAAVTPTVGELGVSSSAFSKTSKSDVRSAKRQQSHRRSHLIMRAIGSHRDPRWLLESGEFEANGERSPLLGTLLKNQKFLNVQADHVAKVTLKIEVPSHGLSVRDQTGVFSSINKARVARIRIAKEYRTMLLDEVVIDGSSN